MSTTSERQPEPTEPAEPTPSSGVLSPRPLRQWRIATTNGLTFSGPLTWAHNDPSVSEVAPEAVARELADVMHYAESPGMPTTVTSPHTEEPDTPLDVEVLRPCVHWTPLSTDPQQRTPRLSIEITPDCFIEVHDLAAYDAFLHHLRTHLDTLDHEIRPLLVAALDEEASNRGAQGVLDQTGQQAAAEPGALGVCAR